MATTDSARALQALVASLCVVSSLECAQAGGGFVYEFGTADVGRAAAGVAAIADSAATALSNPAGMVRLEGSQLLAGVQAIDYRAEFESQAGTTFGGGDGGNGGRVLPSAATFYVHEISPDFKVGFSLASFFGAGLDYGNQWSGRYYVSKVDLLTAVAEPSVAYRVNDWLSVGGGVGVLFGTWDQDVNVNNPGPGRADGNLSIDGTAAGVFGSAGILVELSPRTRIGVGYISQSELEFDDVVEFRGLGPILTAGLTASGLLGSEVDIELTIPQQLMLSGYHQVSDELELMANLGWQDWSEFGLPTITVASSTSRSVTVDRDFDDTYHVALGGRYTLDNGWRLSTGIAYDTSAVGSAARTPDFPVDRQWRFSFGAERQWRDNMKIGFAYTYMDGGDAAINQEGGPLKGSLVGEYDRNHIQFFAAYLDWKF